ncbi:hypothetical protein [Streptococcus cristatus]|uniref:hypothetical protein n=1 Tax=Streptococcus cristatus TaxID=45634 RepID=UPI001EF263DE|nr:hypothetical protein [Streptococcus cristatus]MCG7330097.1 hypothetical protein [Streptococcus cristatus]
MPYESGGRADKLGNKYEFNWIVLKFIDVISEKIDAIKVEAIGEEEEGVDVWVRYSNGITEAQQCKGRNASKDYWTLSDLNSRGILKYWKLHLSRDLTTKVSLVSPLPFTNFLILKLLTSEYRDKLYYYFLKSLEKQVSISDYENIIFETVSNIVSKNNELKLEPYYYRRIEEYLSRLMMQLYDKHMGDDIADRCLDIIDQMFENEFGSSRTLIEELMNK